MKYEPTENPKKIAVVGAGPAGLAYATVAAERGHHVSLYDAASEIGGQFNLAKLVPGKEEFYETLRYYNRMIEKLRVDLHLNTRVDADMLADGGFDNIIIATGISPRVPELEGINHPSVVGYVDALRGTKPVGSRVAIMGAGGIGYELKNTISWGQGKFDEAAAIFILLFLAIVVVDNLSDLARNRLTHGGKK